MSFPSLADFAAFPSLHTYECAIALFLQTVVEMTYLQDCLPNALGCRRFCNYGDHWPNAFV